MVESCPHECRIVTLGQQLLSLSPNREAAEREAANKRYWTLHQQGKTDEARADLARLAIIRKQREEAAAQRLAEAKGKTTGCLHVPD